MNAYCVVAVDGIRARFFCLEKAERPGVAPGPNLVEQPEALINTEGDMPSRDLFSDTQTGRNAAHGMSHSYDDHRDQHADEVQRRFAKQVAEAALKLAERHKPRTLVLAAEKQMLGFLRSALHVPPKAGFEVKEVAKDLSRLSPQELQNHLAAEGMLPARTKPAV